MNSNVESPLAAYLTGEAWMAKDTSGHRPTHNQVAELAYSLYEVRGRQDGHAGEDWLLAEERLVNGSVTSSGFDAASAGRNGQST